MTISDGQNLIQSVEALREIIPMPHPDLELKKISELEVHSRQFIENSPFVAITTRRLDGTTVSATSGGRRGFVKIVDNKTLLLPNYSVNPSSSLTENLSVTSSIGMLFVVPGITQTLRLNGRAYPVKAEQVGAEFWEAEQKPSEIIRVEIEELFLHCSKAFVRSKLWKAETEVEINFAGTEFSFSTSNEINTESRRFIEASPFLMLSTMRATGQADVSPRGDPRGFVKVLNNKNLLIPDRPGNRLADSYTNMLDNPRTSLLFLIPGLNMTLQVNGIPRLTNNPNLLELLVVQNKLPQLAIELEVTEVRLEHSEALERADLWNQAAYLAAEKLASAGQMLVSHLQPKGLSPEITPELVDASLARDAEENLY